MSTFVHTLYGLYKDGALLTHVSDNTATLQALAGPNDCIMEIDTSSPSVASDPVEKPIESSEDNFLIFENDRDKWYGFGFLLFGSQLIYCQLLIFFGK